MGIISKVLSTIAPEKYQVYQENVRHQATMHRLSNLRVTIAGDIHFNRAMARRLNDNYPAFRNQGNFQETNIRTVEPASPDTLSVFQKIRLWFTKKPANIDEFRFTNQLEEVHLASQINLGGEEDRTVGDVVSRDMLLAQIDTELARGDLSEGKGATPLKPLSQPEILLKQRILDSLNRTLNGAFVFKQDPSGQITIHSRHEIEITNPVQIERVSHDYEDIDLPNENTPLLQSSSDYSVIRPRMQSEQLQHSLGIISQNPAKENAIVAFAQAYENAQEEDENGQMAIDWRNPALINATEDMAGMGHRAVAILIRQNPDEIAHIADDFEEQVYSARCALSLAHEKNDVESYVRSLAEFHYAQGAYRMALQESLRVALPSESQRNFYGAVVSNRFNPKIHVNEALGNKIRAEYAQKAQELIAQTPVAELRRILATEDARLDQLEGQIQLIDAQEDANFEDGITSMRDPQVVNLVKEKTIAWAQRYASAEIVSALTEFFSETPETEFQAHDLLAKLASNSAKATMEHDRQIAHQMIALEGNLAELVATLYKIDILDINQKQAIGFLHRFDATMTNIKSIAKSNPEALVQMGIDHRFQAMLEEVRRNNSDPRELMRAIIANESLANAFAGAQFMEAELPVAPPIAEVTDSADDFVLVNEALEELDVPVPEDSIYGTLGEESAYGRLGRSVSVSSEGDYATLSHVGMRPSAITPTRVARAESPAYDTVHRPVSPTPFVLVDDVNGYSTVNRPASPNVGVRSVSVPLTSGYEQVRPLSSLSENLRTSLKPVPLPSMEPMASISRQMHDAKVGFIDAWIQSYPNFDESGDLRLAKHIYRQEVTEQFRADIGNMDEEELSLLVESLIEQSDLLNAQLEKLKENLYLSSHDEVNQEALHALAEAEARVFALEVQSNIFDEYNQML